MPRTLSIPNSLYPLLSVAFASCIIALPAQAVSFGVYDSRGLAMGGTAVASGTTAQAQFYNPALLSFNDNDEDDGHDGRISFPNLVVQLSESTNTAIDAVDEGLDEQLSDAINNFNLNPGSESAGPVALAARDLDAFLDDLGNQDLTIDAFLGFSVSEPSKREGGAFFIGLRALGAGTSAISAEDRSLLESYIAAMESLAAGGPVDPALLDDNGNLRDPVDELTSNGDVSALAIAEWGVALAHEFELFGQDISLGITPKLMMVDAYRNTLDVGGNVDSLDNQAARFSDSQKTHLTFNADLGIAAVFADHYRVGISVKDALSKEFSTRQGEDPETGEPLPELNVTLKPRSRMGIAYVNERFTLGMDYDLHESTPLANEAPHQDLSLGMEYHLLDSLALRAGYRQDQTKVRADVVSGGIGYQWRRAVFELSYAKNSEFEAGSLQFAWAF